MDLVFTNVYIFILATVLAILEIQIEGAHGWAKNLPTWRPFPGHPIAKIYAKIMSGKELTGYHSAMFTFVFLIFHLPYFFGLTFTLEHWLKTISLFFIFIALWDFLWFVFNPFHPIKNFAKNNPNHKSFFLGMPLDYYYALAISLVPTLVGGFGGWWLANMGLFVGQTILAILFSLYVLDIDNWVEK